MSARLQPADAPAPAPGKEARRRIPGVPPAWQRWLPYVLLLVAIWAIPAFLFKPSDEGNNYTLSVLVTVGIHTLLAVGLNLLMGYAGQVSLGHAAFYGIGAYCSAVLTTQGVPAEVVTPVALAIAGMAAAAGLAGLLRSQSGRYMLALAGFVLPAGLLAFLGPWHWLPYLAAVACCAAIPRLCRLAPLRLLGAYAFGAAAGGAAYAILSHAGTGGMSPWLAMAAGICLSCLVAYLLGIQTIRLQGHYLAMATLGFGIIVSILFREWSPVTGGTSGIYGIPNLELGGRSLGKDAPMFLFVWLLVAAVMALSDNIVNSRVGRAFRAVHGSETAAVTLGVDTGRYKLQVLVLSAGLASLAGSLYAHYVTFISPEPFGFKCSVELVVMVVVGGMASIWGAIFGAGAITILGEVLRGLGDARAPLLGFPLADLDVVIFGLVLMLIMIYLPAGLVRGTVDSAKFALRLARRKRKEP